MVRTLLSLLLAAILLTTTALAQGPVILMGIDAEDGGPGSHGPTAAYVDVLSSGIVPNVTNGGAGILVIGGGKSPTDNVTRFWNEVAGDSGLTVTYVNGPANITAQSFSGLGIIGIASSVSDTPGGGLTPAESVALNARSADIGLHINGGGGLLGFSQGGIVDPYGYLGALGAFTVNTGLGFADITPTADGLAVGITDTNLDVCCWHDEYPAFPSFLNVLATNDSTGTPCALGGFDVIVNDGIVLTPVFAQKTVSSSHTVTANVADGMGSPLAGVSVAFEITSGPHAGFMGSDTTDSIGDARFSYVGTAAGTDVIIANFVDGRGATVLSNEAQCEWIDSDCFLLDFETEDDLATPLLNGQDISTTEEFGALVLVDGIGMSGNGAAIFESDPAGSNASSPDSDLLVGTGNLLILQEQAGQSSPGFYDSPNDDRMGGILSFDFLQNSELCSINLVDIDVVTGLDQTAVVTLVDSSNRERVYTVPSGWTEDRAIDGGAGFGTLDLRTMMPQAGFLSTATATQDAGFDSGRVRIMFVDLASSGGIDDVAFIPKSAAARTLKALSKSRGAGMHAPGF